MHYTFDDCCGQPEMCFNPAARNCRFNVGHGGSVAPSAGGAVSPEEGGPPPIGTCGQECGKKLIFDPPTVQGAVIPAPTSAEMPDG